MFSHPGIWISSGWFPTHVLDIQNNLSCQDVSCLLLEYMWGSELPSCQMTPQGFRSACFTRDNKLHLLVQELQLTARGSRSDAKPIKLQRERRGNLKFSAMIGKSLLQETPLSRRWKHHIVEPFGTWKHIYLCFPLLVVVSPFGLLN